VTDIKAHSASTTTALASKGRYYQHQDAKFLSDEIASEAGRIFDQHHAEP
jgi:hypothetical protein